MESSDSELVGQARQGDKGAFGELVKRHSGMAARLAARLVGEECARDMVQEGVLQAYLSLDWLHNENAFGSWLCGMVLNLCRSHCRAQRGEFLSWEDLAGGVFREEAFLVSPEPTPEEWAETQELHRLVLQAMEGLSTKVRRAVWLFYFEQLSVREIAALLECSTGAVKGRLFTARGELRERLQPLWTALRETGERRDRMIRVEIADVIPFGSDSPSAFVVKLLDRQNRRYLPITIGHFEGQSLTLGLRKTTFARPLTYRLLAGVLEALGGELEEVRIEKLEEQTFYAVAKVHRGEQVKELDSRPSDAMNLAVLTGSPIYVAEEVFAKVGMGCTEAEMEGFGKVLSAPVVSLRETLWKLPKVIRAHTDKPDSEAQPVRLELARGPVDRQVLDGMKAGDLLRVGRESPTLCVGEEPLFTGVIADLEGKLGLRVHARIERQTGQKEADEVVVELGRGWLTRAQVEELEAGAAIQVDKKIDDPVEVWVNGVLFVRGEAVRVEGEIGMRVAERMA